MATDWNALAAPGVRKLTAYDPGHDPGTLKRQLGLTELTELGSNENSFGPSPAVFRALQAPLGELYRYPDAGARGLKSALARRYGLEDRQFVIGNGSHELLVLLAETLVAPGEEVVFPQYGFAVFKIAATQCGGTPVEVPATADRGADPDAMIAAFGPRTRLVYLANPNNPTGTHWDAATLQRVLAALPPQAIFVLDEAYAEYADPAVVADGLALLPSHPRLVVTRTFSKAYGLAGLRLGYAVADPGLCQLLERTRLSFNGNLLALAAGEAALGDQAWVAQVRDQTRASRDYLLLGLQALKLDARASQGNFVLVDFHRPAAPIEAALMARAVLVRPMGAYGLPTCSRITAGTLREIDALLDALAAVLDGQ